MPLPHINRWGFNVGSGGYSTANKAPNFQTEQRIKLPKIIKRPLRFQARTLIRHKLLRKDPYWFTLHVRGPRRPKYGIDPLEMRAVSKNLIRGTLPERIFWQFLVADLHLVPWFDFIFQSSLQGGRIQLGGIVADFLFPNYHFVVQVDGPTHSQVIRVHKDGEQDMALEEMGYQVYHILEQTIFDEYAFNVWMEKLFGWAHSGGPESANDYEEVPAMNGFQLAKAYGMITDLGSITNGIK